jgi:hypothetical protein
MNTDNKNTEPEKDKKYNGAAHFFLVFGGVIVLLILLKLVIDRLM